MYVVRRYRDSKNYHLSLCGVARDSTPGRMGKLIGVAHQSLPNAAFLGTYNRCSPSCGWVALPLEDIVHAV